jgi:hypothetical protein
MQGLKKRDVILLKDLVADKIKKTEWVLKNKKNIQDPDQLKENIEGYKELLDRINKALEGGKE